MLKLTSTEETKAVNSDEIENLLSGRLLLQEAERRKITIPDAEAAQRAREFQVAGASGQAITPGGAPDAQLMNAVRGSMMIEKIPDDEFRDQRDHTSNAKSKHY